MPKIDGQQVEIRELRNQKLVTVENGIARTSNTVTDYIVWLEKRVSSLETKLEHLESTFIEHILLKGNDGK